MPCDNLMSYAIVFCIFQKRLILNCIIALQRQTVKFNKLTQLFYNAITYYYTLHKK